MSRSRILSLGVVLCAWSGLASAGGLAVSIDDLSVFNFDAVGTQNEIDACNAYEAGLGYDEDHRLQDYIPEPPGAGTGYYNGISHWYMDAYWNSCLYAGGAGGMASVITTPYGQYALQPYEKVDAGALVGYTGAPNAIRIGTNRGKSNPDAGSVSSVTIDIADGKYNDINLLMSGSCWGNAAASGTSYYGQKRAWVYVIANYADTSTAQVWKSPRIDVFEGTATRDPYPEAWRNDIPGGIPIAVDSQLGTDPNLDPADWAAYMAEFNLVQTGTRYAGAAGGSPNRYSLPRDGDVNLYDVAGGIAVDPDKTLVSIDVVVDNGPNLWVTGYPEGENMNVYAVSGNVVPEPGTLGLLAVGAAAAILRRRRRR